MKYKVGDKVRIKSLDWYHENKNHCGEIPLFKPSGLFVPDMSRYCNNIMTIKDICYGTCYRMKEDFWKYNWTDEMIEGLVEEEIKPEPKFKVGDKVILDPYPCVVTDVNWRDSLHGFAYTVRGADFGKMVGEEDLVLDESEKKLSDESWRYKNIFDSSQYPQSFECPEGYIFKDENGNVINAQKIVLEKKKKEYPKTFLECCDVLNIGNLIERGVKGYKAELFDTLQKLYICRDAYWKIAGEEMGLGKPWEPDWKNSEERRYCIVNIEGDINLPEKVLTKWILKVTNKILVFPTEEMRDAFYDNFKEEIEICKELL